MSRILRLINIREKKNIRAQCWLTKAASLTDSLLGLSSLSNF